MKKRKLPMKKRIVIIVLSLAILIMVPFAIFVYRFMFVLWYFGMLQEGTHAYKPYAALSYDGKYILQTIKLEPQSKSDVVAATFVIKSADTNDVVYEAPHGYRVFDLFYMNWYGDTYDVYVKSSDVGSYLYHYVDGRWEQQLADSDLELIPDI